MPANLAPLKHRGFRLLWSAGAISDIGTWVQLATIGTLLIGSGSSAMATALVYAATFVPQALCSPLGGVLADRIDRRQIFLRSLAVQTVATAVLATIIAMGERRAGVLGLFVLLQAGAGSIGQPALQAVLPDMVPSEELTAAVALGITAWNTGRIVGPLLALMLSPIGAAGCVGANAASFAVLWIAVWRMRRSFMPVARPHESIRAEMADGARNLVRIPAVVFSCLALAVMHLTYITFMGTVPIKAKALLDDPAVSDALLRRTVGILMSAQGIGAVVGSLLVAHLMYRVRRSQIVVVGLLVGTSVCAAYAVSPGLVMAIPAIAVVGGATSILASVFGGVVQRDAPPAHRGRVLSWYFGSMGLSYGFGLLLIGRLADSIGIARALSSAAVVMFVLTLVGAVLIPHWRDRLDHGDPILIRLNSLKRA